MKIRLCLIDANEEQYKIVRDGLSGKKISSEIQFVADQKTAHLVLECSQLKTEEQFSKASSKIFSQIWAAHKNINTRIQKNQKKIRK